jgi:hypothetical protein
MDSYEDEDTPRDISEVTRRDILDFILSRDRPFHGRLDLMAFLKRIWDLSAMPSTDSRYSNAERDIWQHAVNFADWEDAQLLLDRLDLLHCDDETFLAFLEQTVHPLTVSGDNERASMVATYNRYLLPAGYVLSRTGTSGAHPVMKARRVGSAEGGEDHGSAYEVVLSFAGEDREYVEQVAEHLRAHSVRCFYDKFEEVDLWGKDLVEYFDRVYRGTARYCVMFISEHYEKKIWTIHERRSALAKAIQEKQEYILPARFDDTEIPGIRPTVGYVSLKDKTPQQFGDLILLKLGYLPSA